MLLPSALSLSPTSPRQNQNPPLSTIKPYRSSGPFYTRMGGGGWDGNEDNKQLPTLTGVDSCGPRLLLLAELEVGFRLNVMVVIHISVRMSY
jgi:hypothetical protein